MKEIHLKELWKELLQKKLNPFSDLFDENLYYKFNKNFVDNMSILINNK